MKYRRAIVFFAVIFCVLLFGVQAFAADGNGDGYDDNDFDKIQAFLDTLSTDGTTTNGVVLNAAYDNTDPTTWSGVTWNSDVSMRVTSIDWYENYTLNGGLNLSGFDALTDVAIGANSIDSLSVAGDTALTNLDVGSNGLYSLDVTTLTALTDLSVRNNNLSSIDISQNAALLNFNCAVNDLTTLDVSSNTSLLSLNCRSNDITSLDLSGLSALTELNASYNDLATIDLSDNTNMETLTLTSNDLTTLDVTMLTSLLALEINSNAITTIDITNNTALDSFSCSGNGMSTLDISSNTSLTYLLCSYNPFGTLDLTSNAALEYIYANNCNLSTINVDNNTNLLYLYVSDNSLTGIDLSNNTALTQLRVANNSITSLSLTNNAALEYLDAENNDLTSLSTASNPNLSTLNAANNQLTSAVVNGSVALSTLTLDNNLLTAIDLSSNINIRTLRLNDNDITSVALTNCTLIEYAYLQNNELTTLDISASTAVDVVQALGNPLYSFDADIGGTAVSIGAKGLGTVGVLYNDAASSFYAVATPNATYDFNDWTDGGGAQLSTSSTYYINFSEATEIYANFTAGVIFDENGGDTPADPAYSLAGPGDYLTPPTTDPGYTGLTFTGWYTEPEQTTLWDFATDQVPASGVLTLYAGWSGDFTVSFDGNGGSPVPSDVTVPYNTTFAEPATVPTRTGYDFGGWCTDAAGTTAWDFATDVVLHDTTLYADWNPQAFNVYYNENGGSTLPYPTSRVVYYNELIPYVTIEPELAGYVIEGWYTESACLNRWDFATDVLTGDTTLYVNWIPGDFSVTFNSPGATTPADPAVLSLGYEDLIAPLPTEPTRTGYVFDAWYLDSGLTTPINFSTYQVTEDVDLYAGWIPNSYTVTFNRNGGDTDAIPATMSVDYDTVIPSQPTAPTRAGYILDAWCTDWGGVNEWDFATDHVLGDMTLYARWAETFTVTFNNNGGDTQASPQTMAVADGNLISPEPIAPTRTGYTFNGWYTNAAATTAWNFAADLVTANTTLYAGWTQNSYTVTYNENGGDTAASPATMSVLYGETISAEPTPPTLAGYLFEAWYTDAGATTLWDFDTDVVTGNMTLYAGYDEYYTVTFDENGGTVAASPATVEVIENATIDTLPTPPIWGGYQFNGWYTDAAATNAWDFATDTVTGDMTLYAGWSSICTVTFDENGGDTAAVPNNKQTLVGGTVTAPSTAPTRAGYTFSGWYTTSAVATPWNFLTPVTSNMTLYAGWTPIQYTVTFNENGGDSLAVPGSVQVGYDQLVSPEPTAPSRSGYTFSGWYTEATAVTEWDFATDTVTSNITLYAGWLASHTVTFSRNGGDTDAVPSSMSVQSGDLISPEPTAPTRVGYTFTGWYTDPATTLAFNMATTAITSDLVLYAGWTINTYTVTFDENGGDTAAFPSAMTVEHGSLVSPEPADPSLTGYAFAGWYTDASLATEWDFGSDIVVGNMTLYASYVPLVTVTFDNNGGDTEAVPSTLDVGEGLTIETMPTEPTRAGYSFVGWFTDAALTTRWVPATDTVTGAMTLYAGWTDIMWVVSFNPNGGRLSSSIESYSVPNGSAINLIPEDPTRSGYTFEGWYADQAGTTAWDFATDTVTEDTVLYAIWAEALALDVSPSNGEIYEDGRIEIIPNIGGGTWVYDDAYLSANITSTGAVFTGILVGETTVTYTVNGQTIQFTITIEDSELPSTGQSFTLLIVLGILFMMMALAAAFVAISQKRMHMKQRG
ncbi:MAG: InlB B-repeat-containing protein [Eubacteriales bacterium]